jgi:hypothetical protein
MNSKFCKLHTSGAKEQGIRKPATNGLTNCFLSVKLVDVEFYKYFFRETTLLFA